MFLVFCVVHNPENLTHEPTDVFQQHSDHTTDSEQLHLTSDSIW